MEFLAVAVTRIGQAKFNEEWTGEEFKAQRSVSSFPPFEGTLNYHREKLAEFEAENPGRVPAALVPSGDIESQREKLRPQYEKTLLEWNRLKKENGPARDRLEWVVQWIAELGRNGDLVTYLRAVNRSGDSAPYTEAPPGFWEVEQLIKSRFGEGRVRIDAESEHRKRQPKECYIFFTETSLTRNLSRLAPLPSVKTKNLYLSEHMQQILEAIETYPGGPITAEQQPTVSELEAYFREAWPHDKRLSITMATAMAKVTRNMESQDPKVAGKKKKRS
jgi:hypothetical protein